MVCSRRKVKCVSMPIRKNCRSSIASETQDLLRPGRRRVENGEKCGYSPQQNSSYPLLACLLCTHLMNQAPILSCILGCLAMSSGRRLRPGFFDSRQRSFQLNGASQVQSLHRDSLVAPRQLAAAHLFKAHVCVEVF